METNATKRKRRTAAVNAAKRGGGKRVKGGRKGPPRGRCFSTAKAKAPRVPEWAEQAYRMWCRGQRNWSALGRVLGVDRETVRDNVRRFTQLLAAAEDAGLMDARQEAIVAHEEIRATAWQDHAAAGNSISARAACLHRAAECTDRIAEYRGVAKHVVMEHQGNEDAPLRLKHSGEMRSTMNSDVEASAEELDRLAKVLTEEAERVRREHETDGRDPS